MLIRAAEVAGVAGLDVRIGDGRILEVARGLEPRPGEPALEAGGGALLPGLHDHHVHLLAWDAARRSLACGPDRVRDADALARRLGEARRRGGWIRGVGYHESVAGALDRRTLDRWVPDRPVRIQHRSGSAWMLNGRALALVGLEGARAVANAPPGVERDARGRPTGRLFHLDAWLRERWPPAPPPDWRGLARTWAGFGVVGATDATPHNGPQEWALFARATRSGWLPQSLLVMGGSDLAGSAGPAAARTPGPRPAAAEAPRVEVGALKIRLEDPQLPDFDAFCEQVARAHAAGRAVAVHCVTRLELVLTVAVLREVGVHPGDRIEHAAVAPPEMIEAVGELGVRVVSQPHFIRERGDGYLEEVERADQPWLYRCRGWLAAGVGFAAGTDAPFGDPDPWHAMRSAIDRRSGSGRRLGRVEALDPESALALFTSPARDPGAPARRVAPGCVADLCLLDRPWSRARERLEAGDVVATLCAGRLAGVSDPDRWTAAGPLAAGAGLNAPRSREAS